MISTDTWRCIRARAGRHTPAHCEGLEPRRLLSAGDLDTAFGGVGFARADFGGAAGDTPAPDVVVQWDGKVVVAGTSNGNFAVARYNADGTPDTTFSGDGRVTTDFGSAHDSAYGVALGPGGRIVVAGGSGGDFAVAVYLANGTPDTAFSGDGKLTVDFGDGGLDGASAVAVQPDGKIVVAGSTWNQEDLSRPAVARLTATGALDPSFSGDGRAVAEHGGVANGVAVDAANRIVVAGNTGGSLSVSGLVARFTPGGAVDPTFGTGGFAYVREEHVFYNTFSDVALQADGRIVAVGLATSMSLMARLTPDGALDTTFRGTGVFASGVDGSETDFRYINLYSVAIAPDGKIVGVGSTYNDSGTIADAVVTRLNVDGSFDPSFGGDGMVTTDFGGDEYAFGVALQPDGRIVLAGRSGTRFLTARFQGDAAVLTAGSLYVTGTPGGDTIRLSNAGGVLTVNVNGTAQTFSTATVSKIFVDAGKGNDRVLLDAGVPGARVDGGAGNDTLTGGNGNDTLRGGDGTDLLVGGGGGDRLEGGGGRDTADYSARTRDVRVSLDGVNNDGELNERDNVLGDVENLVGGAGNDVLAAGTAGWGNEVLDGRAGNDRLYGYQGNDQLLGGAGNDTLDAGPGNDTLTGSEGNDVLYGGEGADRMDGGAGGDTLYGHAGDDSIFARDGARDVLDGGPGVDRAQLDAIDSRTAIEVLLA